MEIHRFESRYLRFHTVCLVSPAKQAVLIDPGVLPEDADRLRQFCEDHRLNLTAVVFTHTHGDHFACWPPFETAPTYGSTRILEKPAARRENDVKYVYSIWRKFRVDAPWAARFPRIDYPLTDNTELQLPVGNALFVDTPGHSTDHSVVVFPSEQVLFSGDMLIQIPQPFILDGFRNYFQSLQTLEALVERFGIQRVIPAHGPELKSPHMIRRQIEREKKYIQDVVQLLRELHRKDLSADAIQAHLLKAFAVNNTILHRHRVNVNTLLREWDSAGPFSLET